MRFVEFSTPVNKNMLSESKVGRALQHLEDLVFIEASEGAMRALDTLENLENDVSDVTVKWDGTPAVVFGRDENGDFILTDNAGFAAKRYDGRVKSAEQLKNMLLSRGKEVTDERVEYANSMKSVWSVFESATPKNFRGFIFGDLMYKTTPRIEENWFVFKPNKVTYKVKASSDIGKQIAQSDAGVVIHKYADLDGEERPASANMLKSGRLFVLPPMTVSKNPDMDNTQIDKLRRKVKKYSSEIDGFLELRPGLKDIRNILYTYTNHAVRNQTTNTLGDDFSEWLSTSSVSAPKQQKINDLMTEYPSAIKVIFDTVKEIAKIKDSVIQHFDNEDGDIQSSIGDTRGGEGYVIAGASTKLVPRTRFIPGQT